MQPLVGNHNSPDINIHRGRTDLLGDKKERLFSLDETNIHFIEGESPSNTAKADLAFKQARIRRGNQTTTNKLNVPLYNK
jgi:hypothetical protein